jgi:hypothetical protein
MRPLQVLSLPQPFLVLKTTSFALRMRVAGPKLKRQRIEERERTDREVEKGRDTQSDGVRR